jgi:hypothetical protein
MLLGTDLLVTVGSGGAEDGTYTFATAVDISCALREFSSPNTSIKVDTTTRCATLVTSRGIRAERKVTLSIDVPDSGTPTFGTSVNTVWQFVIKYITTGSSETLQGAIRENSISSSADGRQVQSVSFDVLAVS